MSITQSAAAKLRAAHGDKPCAHRTIDAERKDHGNAWTGDYICETCGKLFFSREQWQYEVKKGSDGRN